MIAKNNAKDYNSQDNFYKKNATNESSQSSEGDKNSYRSSEDMSKPVSITSGYFTFFEDAVWNTNHIHHMKGCKRPPLRSDETSLFCDYLTFHSSKMIMKQFDFEVFKELILGCTIFGFKVPLEIIESECTEPFYKGSKESFNRRFKNIIGMTMFAKIDEDNNEITAMRLQMTGEPLKSVLPRNNQTLLAKVLHFIKTFTKGQLKPTRFDICLEFSHDLLDLNKVWEVTHFRREHRAIFNAEEPIIDYYSDGICGCTFKIGKLSSERHFKLYETTKKHGYHGIRNEGVHRDNYARVICDYFVDMYENSIRENGMEFINKRTKYPFVWFAFGIDKIDFNNALNADLNYFLKDILLGDNGLNYYHKSSIKTNRGRKEWKKVHFWEQFKLKINVIGLNIKFASQEPKLLQNAMRHVFDKTMGAWCAISQIFGIEGAVATFRVALERKLKGIGCTQFGGSTPHKIMIETIKEYGRGFWIKGFDKFLLEDLKILGFIEKAINFPINENYGYGTS